MNPGQSPESLDHCLELPLQRCSTWIFLLLCIHHTYVEQYLVTLTPPKACSINIGDQSDISQIMYQGAGREICVYCLVQPIRTFASSHTALGNIRASSRLQCMCERGLCLRWCSNMAAACVSPQVKLQGTGYRFNVPFFTGGQIHLVALLFCIETIKHKSHGTRLNTL